MIAGELRKHLVSIVPEQDIAELHVGPRYTAVMLEDGSVGVAYTFRKHALADPRVPTSSPRPKGSTTTEMLGWLESDNGLERSIGLAVANALANRRSAGQHEADVLSVLSAGFLDRLGMVGYFAPLVEHLRKRVRELVIFERNPDHSAGVLPAEQAFVELPRCDVALITATALVLGDIDRLLEATTECREVALVGPSTPLVPDVFAPYGVTLVSGVIVADGPGILRVVAKGGGMGDFGERVRKVNMRP